MKKRQSDKKGTKQVRIDAEMHRQLKIVASRASTSIKALLQAYVGEILAREDK